MYGTIFVSEMLNMFEETFEVTEIRAHIETRAIFFVGGGGGELFVVLYGKYCISVAVMHKGTRRGIARPYSPHTRVSSL